MADDLRALAEVATEGEWEYATAPAEGRSLDLKAEYLRGTLADNGEPIHLLIVRTPNHPKFVYIVPALTGDGPTSEANARWIAAANPAAVLALLDERDVIAESLGGMVEWMSEVICDAREALVAERLRYVGDLRGSRPPGKVPIDMGAVLAILDRERNADPSRFDAMRDERDALRAEASRLRPMVGEPDGE